MLLGRPADHLVWSPLSDLPRFLKGPALRLLLRHARGAPARCGLPEPVRGPLAGHPSTSDELLAQPARGAVTPKPGVSSFGRDTAVERRMHTSRALMRRAPRPVSLGTLRLLMRPRHASLTGTYFPAAVPQPVLGEARWDGALGLGAPLPGQLCHLTLLRYRAECTLSVVHGTAFARGADPPGL
ncbi:hypothetical protein OG936_01800 [Streptomyces sp. NBC_00846]|uniref:hypothetical protein n=1 Tax=Streptomyces sp. NBC_00846 TaxID=2975849 RepID=UPI00386B4A59|nr:hypothetical protein OG936_01800 [Streptomyces sp. NBC_00846]